MSLIVGSPRFQWFIAATGQPAVGYLVYSYIGGTTTPLATYVDTGLITTNTNPVVLDSLGSASIVTNGKTKLVLTDPNNNVIWTYDNIGSSGANIYDVNGNGLLEFTTTTNAVNYINITNNSTGNAPIISALGGDSNIALNIVTKGSGALNVTASSLILSSAILTANSVTTILPAVATTMPAVQATANNQALIASTAGVQSYSIHSLPTADGASGASVTTNGSAVLSLTMVPPTGAVMMWTTTTAPTGWLECNGAAVSRTTYATLFALVGTTFGTGDGSTTFNLPQTQRQVIVGRGGSVVNSNLANTIGSQYGQEQFVLGNTNMPVGVPVTTNGSVANTFVAGSGSSAYTPGTNTAGWSLGAATAINNLQPSLVLMYIIKT